MAKYSEKFVLVFGAIFALTATDVNGGGEGWRSFLPTFSDIFSVLSIDPSNVIQLRQPIFAPYAPAKVAAVLNVGSTTTAAGRVFIYQEEANTDVIFTATAFNTAALPAATYTIEIRTSLSCAAPGALYNPQNVVNGGVVTSTPFTIDAANAGFLSVVRKNIPPTQVSLFGNYNIVGRSVVVRNAATGATALCGLLIVG